VAPLVVIGASVGGLEALSLIFPCLPADFPASILLVSHVGSRKTALPEVLGRCCALPVRHARDGELVLPGQVLLAPPGRHMLLTLSAGQRTIKLSHGPREHHTRPAIDPLFRSAASTGGANVVGLILSGYLDDGTAGLQAIKAGGGKAVVQEPSDALAPSMPQSALDKVNVDWCLPADKIGPLLLALASPPA
jgi:two-component system, chemotaxis family, protein-glutamate methylesterase/glutaminase